MTQNIKTVNLVYFISFLDLFAVGLTFPLLSAYLRDLGASHSTVGFLRSTYSGVQILTGPVIGGWSDVRDRRSVLLTTLYICGICYGLLGFTSSLYIIFVLRFLLGVFKHTQSICKAVICDTVPANEQAGVFGRSAAFGSIGFIAGPLLGGHLSELKDGFSYVCLIASMVFLVNIVLTTFLPSDTVKHKKAHKRVGILKKIREEFKKTIYDLTSINWKVHWDSFLLRFLFALAVTSFFTNETMFLKEKYSLSQKHVGYTISFFSSIGTASAFFLNLINRFYPNDTKCLSRLLHFFTLMTISLLGIFLTSNFVIFLVLVVPFSISSTVLRVVSMEMMIKKSGNTQRGSLSGASNSVMSVARFVTPLLSGFIGDILDENAVMLSAAVPTFIGAAVCLYLMNIRKSKSM